MDWQEPRQVLDRLNVALGSVPRGSGACSQLQRLETGRPFPAIINSEANVTTMVLDDCENIFHQALLSESESAFCRAIEPLLKEYEILSLELGRGSVFWRARLIENEVYPNISDLDYPPAEHAGQGRLNDRGAPCFYIATRKETALAEVGATEGQLVQLAGFRIKNESPIRLAVIGEYANVQKNGYMHFAGRDPEMAIARILNAMPRQEAFRKIYIDKFLASVLADPNASDNGYMFSRALGQAIYSRGGAEGIVFPSVKDRGGFNISVQAAPSDRSFHNVSCLVVRMGKPRNFGLIEFAIVKSAERLDGNSKFIWLDEGESEVIGIYNMSKEEFEMASCNPDDRNNLLNMLHTRTEHR
ncbi:hypothetical protein CJO94_12090 [Ralstonia solanacearum]|nr:hypothetical protein CJO94_12090 [Ralstonia solanacearum]